MLPKEKPHVYKFIPEIWKDLFTSLMDYCQDYDLTWLIQYLTENFKPEEIYGEQYMQQWAEDNDYVQRW